MNIHSAIAAVLVTCSCASQLSARTDTSDRADPRGPAAISFAAPRVFATGATPSAAAFNRAEGDQLGVQATRLSLSDSIATGNFDEDPHGHLDVVQTNVLAGTLSVFRGDGHGGFAAPRLVRAGAQPSFVAAGHLDRDSHLDVVVVDVGASAIVTLSGNGHGSFALSQTIPVAPPRHVAIGDVNGDHVADLAVASRASHAPTGGVTILTGAAADTGAVTFTPAQFVPLTYDGHPIGANAVALSDFDGSGFDDLTVGVGTSNSAGDVPAGATEPTGDDLLVYRNRNAPTGAAFGRSPSQRFRVGATPDAIAASDWNGDRHADLVVMSSQSGDITALLGDGAGTFAKAATSTTVGALPRSLAVADFDGDRKADLVTASFAMSTASVLRGRGDGTFEPAADFWAGDAPTAVAVGDFDDDTRPDIAVARLRNDRLALLRNESPRSGDGVTVTRDIPYRDAAEDEFAAHHTLDVYAPPSGAPSFAGKATQYPVVLFAHGGAGITGDKSMVAHFMRSLAREGIVAVTTDYNLAGNTDVQAGDYAAAFGWLRENVVSFGGDPRNIVVSGTSAGAAAASRFATSDNFTADHSHVRAMAFVGGPSSDWAKFGDVPWLAIDGDSGLEQALTPQAFGFVSLAKARGHDARFQQVPNRDHLTIVSNLARDNDRGRAALLHFLRRVTG